MKKKQIQNRDFYMNTGINTSVANRITIPMEYPKHVDMAHRVFKLLAEALEDISKLKVSGYRKVNYAKMEIYNCHRALIEEADESYNHKYRNGPKVDYKNAK